MGPWLQEAFDKEEDHKDSIENDHENCQDKSCGVQMIPSCPQGLLDDTKRTDFDGIVVVNVGDDTEEDAEVENTESYKE